MPTLPPYPKSYCAEVIRSDGDRTMLYIDGWMRRIEFYPNAGYSTIVSSRPDKRVIWSLSPDTKTYSQAKMPDGMERTFDPDTLYDWSEDGTQMIGHRRYRRFVGRYREPHGSIGDAREVCLVDAKTGMRRRVDSYDVNGKVVMTIEYLNAKVGAPTSEDFRDARGI